MTDGIGFDIYANDKTGAGINSALGNVQKFNASVKQAGSNAFSNSLIQNGNKVNSLLMQQAQNAGLSAFQMNNMAAASGMWSKEQLRAAGNQSMLARKSMELTDAVKRGILTTDQAGRAYRDYSNSLMTFGDKYGVVREKLAAVGSQLVKFGAAGVGVAYAGKQIYDFAKSGAQLEYTQIRFDRLSKSMGTTGGVFMDQLRTATRGTVSDMKLAENAANLFQLGLARSSDEAVRLSKVQTALGMDTGELTLALANQSKRRLDQLGLSLTKFNEIEGKLRDKGMSKEDAFREAFMLTAEDTIRTTGNMADSSLGSFQRLEAGGANIWNQMKMSAPNASMGWLFGGDTVAQTADKVGMFLNGMSNLMSGNTVFDMSGGLGADSWVRQARAQDKSSLWASRPTNMSRFGGIEQAQIGLSGLQNYTAMAYQYAGQAQGGLGATPPQTEEAAPPDYNAMIQGGMALTKNSKDYSQSLDELNGKLAEQQDLMDKYGSRYGETSKKYLDAKDNANALKGAIGELEAEQDAQGAAFALSMMQADEAFDPSKAYDFAAASGLITKQAAEQYKAYEKTKKAITDNVLTAEQGAYAIKALSGDVSALNGMSSEVWIDIYYRTHGSFAANWGAPGTTSENFTMQNRPSGGEVIDTGATNTGAAGGILDGKSWTIVGDRPGGGFTPYTEAISPDGRVYDAQTTKWMRDQGLLTNAVPLAMGTGDAGGGGGMSSAGYAYINRRRAASMLTPSGGNDVVMAEIGDMKKAVADLTAVVAKMTANSRQTDLSQNSIRGIGSAVGTTLQQLGVV